MGTSITRAKRGNKAHRASPAPRAASDPPPQAAAFVPPAPPQAALSGAPLRACSCRHATNAGGNRRAWSRRIAVAAGRSRSSQQPPSPDAKTAAGQDRTRTRSSTPHRAGRLQLRVEEDEAAENGGGALPPSSGGVGGGGGGRDDGQPSARRDKALPFEFRALEVCLEFSCKSLEQETCTLEKEAYPALDELSSNVSTLNLERVRQIKSRLLAISGRVQKVRDELEHLLDDDVDMAAMHLSDKIAYYQAAVDGRSSRFDTNNEPSEFDEERDREEGEEGEGSFSEGGNGNGTSVVGFTPKIDELENLLEAYFVQVDGTLNKLSTLREYVDDTEDYINIMLDDKQNQLLQMGILLSTATLVMSCAIAITGVFGMNITIPLYTASTEGVFWEVTGGIVGATVAIYLVALIFFKRSGILQ
ncbi:hypothetical protein BDA96_06G090200 [Sorghum bicolor]|uniref:Magnesium transporter n=1 Tax=Sorghum bicolor TaxID=4558 RepID=A0A921UBQ8_SORBI|nr:hypothetical protein BDA96_06G090200 [Sorghum bicolor]